MCALVSLLVISSGLLSKAIELGGDAVKTQALDDPDLQGVWGSEEE